MRNLFKSIRDNGLTGILFICVLSLVSAGCGTKLFPKPYGQEAPPQVRDLQTRVLPRSVEISWSMPGGTLPAGLRFSIMRSELTWENRACAECPGVAQQEVQRLDVASAQKTLSADKKIKWTDSNVAVRKAYRYQIALTQADGTPLTLSNPAVAAVFPAPVAVVGVGAMTQPNGILIQWKPVSKDIEGNKLQGELVFQVERTAGDKTWERVSPAQLKGNSFLDQSIASEQNYSYRVIPVLIVENNPVYGEPSQVAIARAPESVLPPPPANVWSVPAKGALEIRWTESEGKNGGYHVYRREGKEIIRLTANPVQHPPFVDPGAKKGATYYYAVSAVSAQQDHKEGLLSKWVEVRNLLTE